MTIKHREDLGTGLRPTGPISPTTMETRLGRFVDFVELTAGMIDPDDIAWGLARTNRFCGHTISALPYSVAQHSVLISRAIGNSPSHAVWGLMHDAHEAYLGDWSRPVQSAIAWYSELARNALAALRERVDAVILERFGILLTSDVREYVAELDNEILVVEADWLMASGGERWGLKRTPRTGERFIWDGEVWDHDLAYRTFRSRMEELGLR